MSRRPTWQQVYERFDPERPADDRALRVDRPDSPASTIIEALDRLLDDLAGVLTEQGRYREAEEIVLQVLDVLRGRGPSPLLDQAERRLAHVRDLLARSRGGSPPTS